MPFFRGAIFSPENVRGRIAFFGKIRPSNFCTPFFSADRAVRPRDKNAIFSWCHFFSPKCTAAASVLFGFLGPSNFWTPFLFRRPRRTSASPSAKLTQVGKGKRFTYRLPSEGLEFTRPCEKKHFTGGDGVNVLAVVGQGKVRQWRYYKGQMNSHSWVHCLDTCVVPALGDMADRSRDADLFVLRDNAPQSHATNAGVAREKLWGMKVEAQPTNSPDCNPLDFGLWRTIAGKMRKHERKWRAAHPYAKWKETLAQYKIRLRQTAFRLTPAEVNRHMRKVKHICARLVKAKGGHIKRD